MEYVSTRGRVAPQSFTDIFLQGLAGDGGLFVPRCYPVFTGEELSKLRGKPYYVVACTVLRLFMPEIPRNVLHKIVGGAYNPQKFGSNDITPLRRLDSNLALMQLSNGPTLAFKDIPLQPVGALMEYAVGERGGQLNVLGATSGDTGSAAAYALRGRTGVRLCMLSPFGRMSRFQQRQMYTIQDDNIVNVVVNGTFDDCQTLVKRVNADADFKQKYRIGAVNSINWARIAAQVVYYIYTWLRMTKANDEVVRFAVPSGNFGNALSAHVARRMGIPLEILVCTNGNDVLHEFFTTGVYRVRKGSEVLVTSSPSMDIAEASNFERFMYDYADRNSATVEHCWNLLREKGRFAVNDNDPGAEYRISSGTATDTEVLVTIRQVYERYGVIIDPHTAVAMKVALERLDANIPTVVAETAQPAKFEDTIREALGFAAPVPEAFAKLAELPEKVIRIDPDPAEVKRIIAEAA